MCSVVYHSLYYKKEIAHQEASGRLLQWAGNSKLEEILHVVRHHEGIHSVRKIENIWTGYAIAHGFFPGMRSITSIQKTADDVRTFNLDGDTSLILILATRNRYFDMDRPLKNFSTIAVSSFTLHWKQSCLNLSEQHGYSPFFFALLF